MNTPFNDNSQSKQNQNYKAYPPYLSLPKIQVVVRKRPLNQKEISKQEQDIIDIPNAQTVVVKAQKTKVDLTKFIEEHSFFFDSTFNQFTTNEEMYMKTVRPMIEAAFNKIKITCFAYGQTGSGKTYTMLGNNDQETITPGMYVLAGYDIFNLLKKEEYKGLTVWVSFYEIYCGKLYDLLNNRNVLIAREDGKQNICIVGLSEKNVMDLKEMMELIEIGLNERTVGVTGANSDSSRSHGIIQIKIKNSNNIQHGKISFIDLAGSERAADTIDTNKQTRIDGAEINKSLLALKECIRALEQEKKHTPFRGSKLTLVLRDSFIGNCRTLMIANISPNLGSSDHTLNTLRYADRLKELRGKSEINIGNGNVNLNYYENKNKKDSSRRDLDTLKPIEINKVIKHEMEHRIKRVSQKKIKITKRLKSNFSYNKLNQFIDSKRRKKEGCINMNESDSSRQHNKIGKNNTSYFNNENSFTNNSQLSKFSGFSFNEENKENLNINGYTDKGIKKKITVNHCSIQSQKALEKENILPVSAKANTKNININDALSFLQDYTTFTEKKRMESNHQSQFNEELKELNEKYESLLKQIAEVQKEYIELHKKHIDEMVSKLKLEMGLIDSLEKKTSISTYVNNLLSIFTFQEEKLSLMKKKLLDFKAMIIEESELKTRITILKQTPSPNSILATNETGTNSSLCKNKDSINSPVISPFNNNSNTHVETTKYKNE